MKLIRLVFLVSSLVFVLSAREQVNVNFSDLEINDFIKLTSKITNKNILINNNITGTVNFVSSTPVYDDELISILVSVLESKGYTLISNGSLYEIVRSTEAAQQNVSVVTNGKNVSGSIMVTQAIKIVGENVDIIAAKIRYLISKTAKLMTMKENNTLLLTDYPKNIETIKQVIKEIDVNNSKFIVKIIYMKNTEAKKLQVRLLDVAKSIFNPNIDSEQVKIILDENINGMIIVGNKKNVERIEELISKLDVESSIDNSVKIFSLKNSDAKAVLASLTEIIAKQIYSDPSLKPSVSMSEDINAIIAIGDPSIVKGIEFIINELDKEKYQVYVQARIINIYKKNAEDLGIKYGFDGAAVSSNGGLYSLATNFGGASISTAASTLITMPANITSGFALGAAIDFLEKNDASKSISNPSILCINNKESSIYVGQTISISNGATVNAISGTTNNYQRKDVGLTLKIKPRVSSNDKVTLEVETTLESIDSLGNPITGEQPVTSKQEVKTQSILRHGESVIIGGLVKNVDKNGISKIPFLSDIPLLGKYLFSSSSQTNEETNLVVVLTPYVIDNSEQLSKLQADLGLLANLQKEYDKEIFDKIEKSKGFKKDTYNHESNTSQINRNMLKQKDNPFSGAM